MKKQAGVITLTLATVMGGVMLVKHKADRSDPTPVVAPLVVDLRPLSSATTTLTMHAIADVQAVHEVLINSRMMGYLTSLPLAEGDRFKKGQLLVRMNPGAQGAVTRSNALDAELAAARANMNVEQERLRRTQALHRIEGASLEQVQTAEAAAAMAASRLSKARENLDSAVVLAPFDGVVSRRMAQAGDSVTPGMPLMKITDSSVGTRILLNVPSHLNPVAVRIGSQSLPLRAWPQAGAGGTRRFEAHATQPHLIPGARMPVELEIYRGDSAVLVPHACILNDDGRQAVVLAARTTPAPASGAAALTPMPRVEALTVNLVAQSEEGAIVKGDGLAGRTVACGSPDILARLQAGMPFRAAPAGG